MGVDQDDAEYRAAVLTGRARALGEMAIFVKRLAVTAPTSADAETSLRAGEDTWSELTSWLSQAALEAVDELAVLRREIDEGTT